MSVKLRLARIGTTNVPVFRLVAIDSRKKRDGRYLEDLGTYNPVTGQLLQFHAQRFAYWVSQGAVQSDTVKKLYKLFQTKGIVQPKVDVVLEPVAVSAAQAAAEKPAPKKAAKHSEPEKSVEVAPTQE